ncbi:MAG: hypothetical protein WBX01_01585 [Nitrososphaeraceae archaeon]|jgi:hypothetical protein
MSLLHDKGKWVSMNNTVDDYNTINSKSYEVTMREGQEEGADNLAVSMIQRCE